MIFLFVHFSLYSIHSLLKVWTAVNSLAVNDISTCSDRWWRGGWNHQFDPDFRGQADPDSNNRGETSAGELNAVNRSLHYWWYSIAYYIARCKKFLTNVNSMCTVFTVYSVQCTNACLFWDDMRFFHDFVTYYKSITLSSLINRLYNLRNITTSKLVAFLKNN
jgi:hypothetical protein